jgi:hypothetical protein
VTIPSSARHRDQAIAFLALLLGPTGRAALTTNGPTPLQPARVARADRGRVPEAIRSLVVAD